jgi:predicted ATPase
MMESPKQVHVWYGEAGSGKTWLAKHLFRDCYHLLDRNHLWMKGYNGQEVLIFDDFHEESSLDKLLSLIDDSQPWKVVIIISNISPEAWYRDAPEEQRQALLSRVRPNTVFFGVNTREASQNQARLNVKEEKKE